ncbi:MAG: GNAT family N-acetyltransferase [Fimbriimonas sp.]
MKSFETSRLHLGRWTPEHAEDAFAIFGDPEVTRWLGGGGFPESVEAMRTAIVDRWIPRQEKAHERGFGFWPSIDKATGRVVGAILLKALPGDGGAETPEIEIGWYVARDLWGRGYASEGAAAVADYALGELGLPELYAIVKPGNDRSVGVTRKLGMEPLGRTTKYYDGLEADLFRKIRE